MHQSETFFEKILMSESKDDEKKDEIKKKKRGWFNKFKPKINVGIDFGTDGTGIAYSLVGDTQERVFIYDKWKLHDGRGNSANKSKVRTAILLDKNGDCMAFGSNALTSYVYQYFLCA